MILRILFLVTAPLWLGLSHEVVRPLRSSLGCWSELVAAPLWLGPSHEVVRPLQSSLGCWSEQRLLHLVPHHRIYCQASLCWALVLWLNDRLDTAIYCNFGFRVESKLLTRTGIIGWWSGAFWFWFWFPFLDDALSDSDLPLSQFLGNRS